MRSRGAYSGCGLPHGAALDLIKGYSQPKKRTGVLPAFRFFAVWDWIGLHRRVANVTLKLLSQIILRVERALDVSEGGSKLLLALRA